MKKIILSYILIISTCTVFCQTQKGSWQAGGSLGYNSTHQTFYGVKSTDNQFIFTPQIGYFVVKNLSLIISASIFSDKVSGPNIYYPVTEKSYIIGPFIRYYFPAGPMVKFFTGAGMGFGSTSGILDGSSHSITAYQFEAGPAFFISQSAAIELGLDYQMTHFKGQSSFYDADQSQFGVRIAIMIYLFLFRDISSVTPQYVHRE